MQSKISALLAASMATGVLSAAIDVCLPRLEQHCNFGVSGVVWEDVEGGTVWWEGAFLHDYKCDLLGEVHGLTGDKWEVPSSGQSPTVFVTPKITQGKYGDITEMKVQAGKFIFDDKLDCYNEDVPEPGQHRIHCRTWYPCNPAEFKRSFRSVHGPRQDTGEKNTRQDPCSPEDANCQDNNAQQNTGEKVTRQAGEPDTPTDICEENYVKCEENNAEPNNDEDTCEDEYLNCVDNNNTGSVEPPPF